MKIDAHQHFWRYDPVEYDWIDESMATIRRDFLPADLKPLLEAHGYDACIAVQARSTLGETAWLLELADANPWIAGVVGWIDLQAEPDVLRRELERFAPHEKFVGVRHIVQAEPDPAFLARPAFERGIAMLAEFDLAYDILVHHPQLPMAVDFACRFPDQRFVLDHIAKPPIKAGDVEPWATELRRLAASPNVLCKLSGLVTEADWSTWTPETLAPYLDVTIDAFGPERLMIGSDWPVCLVAGGYAAVMDVVERKVTALSTTERAAILGGNARRFWGLA